MNLSGVDMGIIGPALLAGVLVLATHVPLGQRVLARGIVFIDLAIAQIAGLGVMAAEVLGWEPQGLRVQIAAISAAWLGALLLTYTERRWPAIQEALIGVAFVVAASAGLLLLANSPHGGEHLQDLLAGQILWVGYHQLLPLAILTLVVLTVLFTFKERLGRLGFYLLFATTVTASVQLVGIYLVFASLIIPPLAARAWSVRWVLPSAYLLGALAYGVGLMLSTRWDLPAGALIVLCLAALGMAAAAAPALWRGQRTLH